MNFNQLVDDAAEKFEVAQALNFSDLAKQAQLQTLFSQLQKQYSKVFNTLFINGKEYKIRSLVLRGLINGNHSKKYLVGIFGLPWHVLK